MVKKNSIARKKNQSSQTPNIWYLVTNHQNMLYMLAAGMVMGPAGFGGKHYSDTLAVFPGCVPLFRDINKGKRYIPAAALQHAISERKHLLPCIASFDLSELEGPAWRLKHDGGCRAIESLTARRLPNDIATILPAPLPINLLRSISFRSDEDRREFEAVARDVANVVIPDFMIKVEESLFRENPDIVWPPQPRQANLMETDDHPQCNDMPPQRSQALGGLLAMLYHAANRSDYGLAAFRVVTGTADENDNKLLKTNPNPVLGAFHAWLESGMWGAQADDLAKIYWGVVDALIQAQSQESQEMPIDTVLSYLESAHSGLQEQTFRDRLRQLIMDMRGCLGLGGGTITELFEYHKGPLSRSLLLFCVREHSVDLLEFSHPMLRDDDYILACILFGVRDGWLRLPKALRDPPLSNYVSYRMAGDEHRSQKSRLAFTSPPPRPVPLRHYFSTLGQEWSAKQKEMALKIAEKCGWDDCVQTHITPRSGAVLDKSKDDKSEITVKGRVSVTEDIDCTLFLKHLGEWPPVSFLIQSEIRRAIGSEEYTGSQHNEGSRS